MAENPIKCPSIDLKTGQRFYFIGPPLEHGPLPAFFYFSLSGSDSLCLEPYNQPAAFAACENLRVFSASLPYHDEYDKKEVMHRWAEDIKKNHDFLTPFLNQTRKSVHELIDGDLIDNKHLAVGGLSRGGLIATHLAAMEKSLQSVVCFAPLTRIAVSETFRQFEDLPILKKQSAFELIPKLINSHIRFYIGNRDEMVKTSVCYEFIRKLTDEAYDAGIRSPQVELIISPSIGYKGHGTPSHIFEDGAKWVKAKLGVKP